MAIQYTIRNIPPEVNAALKRKAKLLNKSFNQTVVDELSNSTNKKSGNNFDWLSNTITPEDAVAFDEAMADLNKPDPKFWQ